MKQILIYSIFLFQGIYLSGQFAPAAGLEGSTAIFKDSSVFVSWAKQCQVSRGYQNIADVSLGYSTAGDSTMALGKAGENGVVSLGDGGSAILTFDAPIVNGPSWDFAIFENGFIDSFLELAFVEVSSDGQNYVRFPATSNTQDTLQIGSFGALEATEIDQLAGKYRAFYGTPFDLEVLQGTPNLDLNSITHIKIIDVVGNISEAYAQLDHVQQKINDPWPTPFPSGGFDLDAVGVIHQKTSSSLSPQDVDLSISVFPNPSSEQLFVRLDLFEAAFIKIEILDLTSGQVIHQIEGKKMEAGNHIIKIETNCNAGRYVLKTTVDHKMYYSPIVIL